MLVSRRTSLALCAVCLSLCVLASTAIAAGPATVTVRVEGLSETKLPATQVTTTTEPVVNDGIAQDSCTGTSALGALQLATGGSWNGPWDASFGQYEIYSIEGESHAFGSGAYWEMLVDHVPSEAGACEREMEAAQEVLFVPCSESASECPDALGMEAPSSANVGEQVSVTIQKYNAKGVPSAIAGATVSGAATSVTTDSNGHATLVFNQPGTVDLQVSAPETVRDEAKVCVHNGNDGTCGTTRASTTSSSTSASNGTGATGVAGFTSYTGPYALVAHANGLIEHHVYGRRHAPRLLSGSILAHSAVSSISLELRREYRGRCYAYNGARERFLSARCGHGSFFKVSSDDSYSYLLPSALAPGRYVLDVQATDAAGDRTTLALGTSRIVFYVR